MLMGIDVNLRSKPILPGQEGLNYKRGFTLTE